MIDEVKFFLEKRQQHIDLVLEYGRKLGFDFTGHDADKMVDPFCKIVAPVNYALGHNLPITPEMKAAKKAQITIHKTSNPHHPEYWANDITKMAEIAMVEMVCDWVAANEADWRKYETNSARNFYETVAKEEYKFSMGQQKFIESILGRLERP